MNRVFFFFFFFFFCLYFCIKRSIGTQGEDGWRRESALNRCSFFFFFFFFVFVFPTDRSKAVVPLSVLLFFILFCFVVYSTRRFVLSLAFCDYVFVIFSPFSIAITPLGEERANLSAFHLVLSVSSSVFVSRVGCGL